MDTKEIFAERILELRKNKGLTRQKVADDLEITRASLEYYEKGKRTPDVNTIVKIAKYYSTNTDYLLGLSNNKTTDIKIKAISEYTGLNDESISFLHDFVKECSNDEYKFNKQSLAFINYLFTGYSKSGNLEDFTDLLDLVDKYLSINNNQHDNYKFDDFSHEEMKEKIQYGISYEIQRIFGGFVKGFHDDIRKKTQRIGIEMNEAFELI